MRPIFDIHTHAYPEKVAGKAVAFLNHYYGVQCQGDGTIEGLKCSAREAGVSGLLVHAVATRPDQVENVNTWIGHEIGGNIYGFGTIHPGYANCEKEIARIKSLGLKGIKLHPDFQQYYADSPEMDKIYEIAESAGLPVLIHTGDKNTDYSSPWRVANIKKRFPRLTIVAAHLGGYSEWDEAVKYLIGRDVYIDTSSSIWALGPERARKIIRAHDIDKILFGTDYPLVKQAGEIERFESLGLSEEEKDKIYWENAQRLLKIDGKNGKDK